MMDREKSRSMDQSSNSYTKGREKTGFVEKPSGKMLNKVAVMPA